MKMAIILGTRPEIIKLAPMMRECVKRGIDFYILHTGQHYDYELDKKIFEDLNIPELKYNLGVGGKPYRMQIGSMVSEMQTILREDRPDVVIVQGDTNSVAAGSLAANKLGIKLVHLEAGLRSHDITMYEETNRIMADHISDILLASTKEGVEYLSAEGIHEDKIFHIGNTIADAVLQHVEIAEEKSDILQTFNLKPGQYILTTAHRAENVDVQSRLKGIIDGLDLVSRETGLEVVYAMHPRAKNMIEKFNIEVPSTIRAVGALGYLDFLKLQKNSKLVITDSGGLQEEAHILNIPCVTLRDSTERPETIDAKTNMLAGTEPAKILEAAREMLLKEMPGYKNLYGPGDAASKAIDIITKVSIKNNGKMNKKEIKSFYSAYSDKITDKRYKSTYPLRAYAHRAQYESILKNVEPGMKVLDAGCGEGTLSIMMAKKGAIVTGVDISRPNISNAKEYAKKEGIINIDFSTADLESLPFEDNSFDLVVSSHVLEHLPDFDKGLKELMRVTKKTAIVAIPTILNPCSWVQVGGGMFWVKGIRSFAGFFVGLGKMILAFIALKEGVNESYVGSDAPHIFRFPSEMYKKAQKYNFHIRSHEASSISLPYFDFLLPIIKKLDKYKHNKIFRSLGYGTTFIVDK